MDEDKDFLRQDNNYRTLKAFQKAECIYDVTYYFANTFLKVGDRSIDQRINGPGVNGQKSNQPTQPIKPTNPTNTVPKGQASDVNDGNLSSQT